MFRSLRTGAASAISSMASRSIVFSLRFGNCCRPLSCSICLTTSWIDSCVPGVEPLDRRHHLGLGGDHPLDLDAQERSAGCRASSGFCGSAIATVTLLSFLFCEIGTTLNAVAIVSLTSSVSSAGIVIVGQLHHLHPELLAQRLQDLVLLDQPHADRHLAEQLAVGPLLLLEDLPEVLLVEVAHVHQDRAESSRHRRPSRGPNRPRIGGGRRARRPPRRSRVSDEPCCRNRQRLDDRDRDSCRDRSRESRRGPRDAAMARESPARDGRCRRIGRPETYRPGSRRRAAAAVTARSAA